MDDRKSIFPLVKEVLIMVRRMILNGTSYFGQGAIQEIVTEVNNHHFKIPRSLRDVGAKEEDIPFLAESAFNDACTPGNPRDCTLEEIADIYKSMFR